MLLFKALICLQLFFSFRAFSQVSLSDKVGEAFNSAVETTKEVVDQVHDKINETKSIRENTKYYLLGNYAVLDLLVPTKYGFSMGAVEDVRRSWELEYLHGSLSVPFIIEDLGKVTDDRISVIGRSYFGNNSFNFNYGLSYFSFLLHLGDKLLNQLTGGAYPSVDLIEVNSVGFHLGIGNRWAINKSATLGIDWVEWSQPVIVTSKKTAFLDYATKQSDRDAVDSLIKTVSYFPRLTIFKIQFGFLF